jgi:XTP/dITP diphosphohydrolase
MPTLLIATNNSHKLAEYREILAGPALDLVSPHDLGLSLDPAETGATFEENAIIKARAFAGAAGLPVLADDSGLEVDALRGAPGIYSARYGNTPQDDHPGRCRLVLKQLDGVPWEARTARFRCVIAIATPHKVVGTVDGRVEGFINYHIRGENGFGYDPIFYVPDFEANLAEVTAARKHTISHRGRAARAAIPLIKQLT